MFFFAKDMPVSVMKSKCSFAASFSADCVSEIVRSKSDLITCMQVELPQKPTDILRPLGGMSQIAHFMLLGIHSMKYDEFLFCTLSICSSTSLVDMRPRKSAHAVR